MGGLTIAQKAITGSHMYKCNIAYRYRFILRWNPRIYFCADKLSLMSRRILIIFPVLGFFLDFRGFWMGGLTFCNFGINLIYGSL